MSGFFSRLLNHLANEFITKKLVESPTFQLFAHKTHRTVESTSKKLQDNFQQASIEARKIVGEVHKEFLNNNNKSAFNDKHKPKL